MSNVSSSSEEMLPQSACRFNSTRSGAACHSIEVGARQADRAFPHGPDPALRAPWLSDRKRWLEPVTRSFRIRPPVARSPSPSRTTSHSNPPSHIIAPPNARASAQNGPFCAPATDRTEAIVPVQNGRDDQRSSDTCLAFVPEAVRRPRGQPPAPRRRLTRQLPGAAWLSDRLPDPCLALNRSAGRPGTPFSDGNRKTGRLAARCRRACPSLSRNPAGRQRRPVSRWAPPSGSPRPGPRGGPGS